MDNLQTLIPLLNLTSGRRISVLNQMHTMALNMNQPVLVERIERSIAHDTQTRAYDNQWAEPTRRSLYTPEVSAIDRHVDIGVTAVRDLTEVQVRGLPENHPLAVEARAMLRDILPAGVAAVTRLPYIEQVAACEVIVASLQNQWAGAVSRLGLAPRLAFLAAHTQTYRQLIDQHRNLTFATVQAYRQQGQQNLREVVVLVLATYLDSSDPAQVAARERLLAPLVVQMADVRARIRTRRNGEQEPDGLEDVAGEPGDQEPGEQQQQLDSADDGNGGPDDRNLDVESPDGRAGDERDGGSDGGLEESLLAPAIAV